MQDHSKEQNTSDRQKRLKKESPKSFRDLETTQ